MSRAARALERDRARWARSNAPVRSRPYSRRLRRAVPSGCALERTVSFQRAFKLFPCASFTDLCALSRDFMFSSFCIRCELRAQSEYSDLLVSSNRTRAGHQSPPAQRRDPRYAMSAKRLLLRYLSRKARPYLRTWGLLQTAKIFNKSAIVWEPGNQRVLVLAPHMDDETLGCGGALAAHVAQGSAVTVVFLTD